MDGSKESSIGDNWHEDPILGKTTVSGNKENPQSQQSNKRNPSVSQGMEIYEQRQSTECQSLRRSPNLASVFMHES